MHQLSDWARGLSWALAIVALSQSALAQDPGGARPDSISKPPGESDVTTGGEVGAGHLGFRIGYYNNEDSGDGNPFLDEELTVVEPVVYFDYNVSQQATLWGKFSYDYVSSASIDRLSKFPDQSGASGDYYFGVDVGARFELSGDSRAGFFLHGSGEYDYNSFGIGGDFARDFDNKNTTLKLAVSGFFDDLDIIRFDGTEEGSDDRLAFNTTATWYQVIDPHTHSEVGLTLTYQDGFLETPYNAVVIEDPSLPPNPNLDNNARGVEITEELPDDRLRGALFGRVRHMVGPSTAVELGGRLYTDDWGITSITIDPRVYQWLIDDKLSARFRYRYYNQSEADDYVDSLTGVTPGTAPRFRTSDSDLGDFDSHTVGFKLDWYLDSGAQLDFSIDYQFRSDGLDNLWASVGYATDF